MSEERMVDVLKKYSTGERRKITFLGRDIYFDKITGADHAAVEKRKPADTYEHSVLMLIRKATDENGQKVFQPGEKYALMNDIGFDALVPLLTFMNESSFATIEEAEEAIQTDPT